MSLTIQLLLFEMLSTLPAAVRDAVRTAVIHGFHDTVLILFGLSIAGMALAFFLKDSRGKEAPVMKSHGKPDPGSQ